MGQPGLGSVNTPYRRLVTAQYGPGGAPRGASQHTKETGYVSALPSPRAIRSDGEYVIYIYKCNIYKCKLRHQCVVLPWRVSLPAT